MPLLPFQVPVMPLQLLQQPLHPLPIPVLSRLSRNWSHTIFPTSTIDRPVSSIARLSSFLVE